MGPEIQLALNDLKVIYAFSGQLRAEFLGLLLILETRTRANDLQSLGGNSQP